MLTRQRELANARRYLKIDHFFDVAKGPASQFPDFVFIEPKYFGLDQNDAEAQMRINAKGLAILGSQEGLPGIGDQAFVQADGMILIRKGKTLVRIMYITCPCGLEQVKPLAKEIADAL